MCGIQFGICFIPSLQPAVMLASPSRSGHRILGISWDLSWEFSCLGGSLTVLDDCSRNGRSTPRRPFCYDIRTSTHIKLDDATRPLESYSSLKTIQNSIPKLFGVTHLLWTGIGIWLDHLCQLSCTNNHIRLWVCHWHRHGVGESEHQTLEHHVSICESLLQEEVLLLQVCLYVHVLVCRKKLLATT